MAMNIPATVRGCLDKFKALREPEDCEAAAADTYSIKNELDRFKIWVGNLAAHRPMGKRSLEYRLRDSNDLRSKVLELLNDLSKAIECYADPPAGRGDDSSASDSDDELPDFEYDDLATQPPNPLRDIHDTINLLYQFSATLRNPAGHNRIKAGVTSMRPYYSEIYINLVRDKFPDAAQYLIERLGGAISSRRQYFKYREEHTSKMNAGLEDLDDGRTTTIASSLPKVVEYVTDIEETETTYSMTSYAPTESETSKLRPPPLPKAGCDGDPFECPICYSIVQVSGETMWKQHIFEDLAPYVCTQENCKLGNKLYTRRRDWQRHQTHMHNRIWACPLGCGSEYHFSDDLNSHLAKKHGHTNQGGRSTRMAYASSRQTDAPFDLQCPLCRKVNTSTTLWFKHVGRHLEQLALQAIDPHKLATESEDEGISGPEMDRISEEDLASYGSSNNDNRADVPILNEEVAPRPDVVALSADEQQRGTAADDPETYTMSPQEPIPYQPFEMESTEEPMREISSSGHGGNLHRSRSLGHGRAPTIDIYNTRADAEESSSNAPSGNRGRRRFEEDVSKNLASLSTENHESGDSTSLQFNSVEGDARSRQERQRHLGNATLDEHPVEAATADAHVYAVDTTLRGDASAFSPLPRSGLAQWQLAQREAELRELSRERQLKLDEDRIKAQARLDTLDNERKLRDAHDKNEADEKRWGHEYERKKREASDKAKADEQALQGRLEREASNTMWTDIGQKSVSTSGSRLEPEYTAKERDNFGTQRISIACAHCRRRKIRCLLAEDDAEQRCQNCIRLKKECVFYPIDQQAALDARSNPPEGGNEVISEKMSESTSERMSGGPGKEDRDAAAYKAFKQKEQDEREAEAIFQSEMRQRLQALGYTDQAIDIMVDEERAKNSKSTVKAQDSGPDVHRSPRAPVYPKVHRDYIAIETLKYYDLPWQYNSSDPDYIIIMRDMEKRDTDILFEHTSRLRSGKILLEPEKKSEKPMAIYRRRSRSRSGRPVEDEVLRKK